MDYQKFIKEHTELTSKVCGVLEAAGVEAEEGELILLWLAGLSLGMRQASLTESNSKSLAMLAVGWQIGAAHEDED